MTILKLSRLCDQLIRNGHARKKVCVQKDTFSSPLENDGAVILPIDKGGLLSFPMIDDDGGVKILADGSESSHTALVLCGDEDPNATFNVGAYIDQGT